jgi:hypothetical protein
MSIVKCTLDLTCKFIDLQKEICRKDEWSNELKKSMVSYLRTEVVSLFSYIIFSYGLLLIPIRVAARWRIPLT